jgi:prophage DNA circulation protein
VGLLLAVPHPSAHAQGFDWGLGFLTNTVNAIGSSILGVNGNITNMINLQQGVVFPVSDLSNIQLNGNTIISNYRGWMSSVFSTPTNSAQTSSARSLESASLNSGGNSTPSQVSAQYSSTYGPLPTSTQAPAAVLQQVDIEDAMAKDSLGLAVLAAQNSTATIQQGNNIESQAMSASAGTAPQLEGVALAYEVQSLAIEHKLYASQLRVLAARLGSLGVTQKQGAVNGSKSTRAVFNLKVTP